MVSFTGSLQAGRCTASVAGDGIKKVCLELGGKSAFVVLDDALFDQAIAAGVNNANDSRYGLAGGVWAGTPETGLLPVSPWAERMAWPICSASQKPASMTMNAARIPGTFFTGLPARHRP